MTAPIHIEVGKGFFSQIENKEFTKTNTSTSLAICWSCFHSLGKFLLNAYCVPGTENRAVTEKINTEHNDHHYCMESDYNTTPGNRVGKGHCHVNGMGILNEYESRHMA